MHDTHTIYFLELARLHPHPMAANVMEPRLRRKLRGLIAAGGRYEPLVVRPHPSIPNEWEIIHGHQRAAVLRELAHAHAACLIWEMTDAESLLALATLNRLRGKEKGRLRLALLRALRAAGIDGQGLPERRATLERVWG